MRVLPDARVRAAAVVLAGGSGSRVGADVNKAYLPLAGAHVVSWSLRTACRLAGIGPVVLVVRPEDDTLARSVLAADLPDAAIRRVEIVAGGATRQGSEHAALDALADRIAAGGLDVVALHDGARPLASTALWRTVIETATRRGGAVPGLPVEPVVGVVDGVLAPPPAGAHLLVRMQTPQAFGAAALLAAYELARARGIETTDTAGTVRACSVVDVRVVPGSPLNLKVTYPHDLAVAERLICLHRAELG